ncbi:MAG: hypothetical protein ACO3N4_02670 [Ilumatobacteraceae bacterium]
MTGTIGHLRNVAALLAALNIEAILAEAGLSSHESATDLALEVEAGVAALREVAALVEDATAEEDAPRCVSSDDSRAVLRAWGGADEHNATLDMGGWTGDEETAGDFLAAVQAEAIRGTGSPLAYVVIEDRDGVAVEEATAEEEEDDAPSFTRRQVSDLRDEAAKAGDIETVEACETWLFDSTDEDAAEIIDEALSYARAMQ